MDLAPVRLASWKEVGGRVVIERPKPTGSGRFHDKLRYWLAVRRIRLDVRGSQTWRLLDGRNSVAEIAVALRQEYGAEVEPAEERVGQLIRMLHDEDLLAYPGWDEMPKRKEC